MPDEYAADVVRKIFAWKINGLSMGAIAKRLNTLQILCPKEYKKSKGIEFRSGFQSSDFPTWSAAQVKRILPNEVYIGNLIQGKQEQISYKVKKRLDKPEEEWIRVENAHEPIIRASDFYAVQRLLKYDGRASRTSEAASLFTGFLVCGDCHTPMIRRVNKTQKGEKVFYICQTKNKNQGCSRHSIEEEVLKQIVLKEIQTYTTLFIDYERVMEELKELEIGWEQFLLRDTQIGRMQQDYNKYYALRASLTDDLKQGIISREEFDEFRELIIWGKV